MAKVRVVLASMVAWPARSIFWDIVDRVDIVERIEEGMLEAYPMSLGG